MNTRYLYAGTAAAMVLAVGVLSWDQFKDIQQQQEAINVAAVEQSEREVGSISSVLKAMPKKEMAARTNKPTIAAAPPAPPSPSGAVSGQAGGSSGGMARDRMMAAPAESYSSNQSYDAAGVATSEALIAPMPYPDVQTQYQGNDNFKQTESNAVKLVSEEPVSTFSIDVDTASYAFVRRQLNYGQLPSPDAVRIEEVVNYFDYDYALPKSKSEPFKPTVSVVPSPWQKGNKLIHIGIKGYDVAKTETPHSNLVFLIDTSGSMMSPDKLPLLISSMKLLVNHLDEEDTVSIVTYAGNAGVVLKPTEISEKEKIIAALDSLQAGGSTAGAEGIATAYQLAEKHFDKKGVNRVILATDGDFNVGITDPDQLKKYIEEKRETGIFLSVIGFGEGNYNDLLMQELAQNGNGNASYIDTIQEAQKVLVHEATSTLFPIAKDVKLQVEFNPAAVSEYRLIGYETRMLKREDFNNDKVDAGDIGAGHAVTAIYEITPKGAKGTVDPLRYGKKAEAEPKGDADEYGFLKIRYKLPKESKSHLITTAINRALETNNLKDAPEDTRFAVAVAAFGQKLKQEDAVSGYEYDAIASLAKSALGEDPFDYRHEFVKLVRTAAGLNQPQTTIAPAPAPVQVPADMEIMPEPAMR